MADYKLTINDPKTGKSFKKDVKDDEATSLEGHNIGDKIKGDAIGLAGYEFEVTGGSDNCGFPMRKDVATPRKKILAVSGLGLKKQRDGQRQRKTVCGKTVAASTSQINLKILKVGKEKLDKPMEAEPTTED